MGEEVVKAKQLFNENSEKAHSVILRCQQYISQFEDDIPSQATTYSFDKLLQANQGNSSKDSKTSSASSKHSNSSS